MKLHVRTQREADAILVQMAKEAGVGVSDMVEIAIYNLIAVWMKERGVGEVPVAVSVVVAPGQRPIVGV